jgi:hypothetical protein
VRKEEMAEEGKYFIQNSYQEDCFSLPKTVERAT